MKLHNTFLLKSLCIIYCMMAGITANEAHSYVAKDVHKWDDIQSLLKGDYKYDKTDVLVNTVYRLTRFYSSANKHRGIFGTGWTANVEASYYITDCGITVLRTANTEYSLYPLAEYDVSTDDEIRKGWFSVCVEGIIYTFDSIRRLIRIKEISSDTFVDIAYDALARIETLSDKYERAITFFYNSERMIGHICDPYGRTVSYTYDKAGNLVCIRGAEIDTEIYVYDAQNRLISIGSKYESFLTNIGYSESGKLAFIKNDGGSETFDYRKITEGELKVVRHEPKGVRKEIFYRAADAAFYVEVCGEIRKNTARKRQRTLNSSTSISAQVDVEYDDCKNLIKQTDDLGRCTFVKYDFWNNPIEIQKPNGNTIYFFYDADKRLVRIEDVNDHTAVQ
ncbi:hypothetical protein KDK77_06515 [bacterium]|nr:hypothetical protein [bacterium]MCP5461674.1 hypothetical protein [bacterium]